MLVRVLHFLLVLLVLLLVVVLALVLVLVLVLLPLLLLGPSAFAFLERPLSRRQPPPLVAREPLARVPTERRRLARPQRPRRNVQHPSPRLKRGRHLVAGRGRGRRLGRLSLAERPPLLGAFAILLRGLLGRRVGRHPLCARRWPGGCGPVVGTEALVKLAAPQPHRTAAAAAAAAANATATALIGCQIRMARVGGQCEPVRM